MRTEVVAGVVHAGTRAATLVEMGGVYVDGRMEINFDCALDCDTMQLHFVGPPRESVPFGVVFDSYLGKGEGPTVTPPDCDGVGDIVGTYTASGFDIFRVPGPPLTDVSMTMEVIGRDGCTFWGHTGDGRSSLGNIPDDGMPLLGLIRSYELEFDLADPIGTRKELSTASIIQMSHVCVNSSAIDPYGRGGEVCVNTSAVVDAHFTLPHSTGEGTVKWHYVGLADDGNNAAVFDAAFTKNRDGNATAAPTTTPGSDGAAGRSAGLLVALAAAAEALF